MKKIKTLLAVALCVGLLTGCQSTPLPMQKALYIATVSGGVAIGVDKYPDAVPYLRVAEPIICAAGNGTNISPLEIIAALTNSPAANAVATKSGKAILSGALILYVSLFDSYGTDWVNQQEKLKTYLGWTCESLALGLPPANQNPTVAAALQVRKLPPHIR